MEFITNERADEAGGWRWRVRIGRGGSRAGGGFAKPATKAAAFKSYKQTIPGSAVSFEMVAIPGGTYMMGSPPTEVGRKNDEGPQHPVTLKPFWIGAKEVTWDEFDEFGTTGRSVKKRTSSRNIPRTPTP